MIFRDGDFTLFAQNLPIVLLETRQFEHG